MSIELTASAKHLRGPITTCVMHSTLFVTDDGQAQLVSDIFDYFITVGKRGDAESIEFHSAPRCGTMDAAMTALDQFREIPDVEYRILVRDEQGKTVKEITAATLLSAFDDLPGAFAAMPAAGYVLCLPANIFE